MLSEFRRYPTFLEGCVTMEVELPADIKSFLDALTAERQLELIDKITAKEDGGKFNMTISHGDFRLENLFFKTDGSDEVPVALIDFQLIAQNSPAWDPIYFLMNSVPSDWRAENELALLNDYYDALTATEKVDPSEYTWEIFLVECKISLIFCAVNPIFTGKQKQRPCFHG